MKSGFLIFLFFAVQTTGQTVSEITESLTYGIENDSLKVVRIYDWVVKNITYDHAFLRKRIEGDTTLLQEPYNVVARKKAVCSGYSKLIKTMCRQVGIEAEVVFGWTKDYRGSFDSQEHAWNVVKINGQWYVLDATWGASGGDAVKNYFLTPPSVFMENHYPHDPMWQLSDKPLGFDCFTKDKKCFDAETTVFNYRDTIAVWQNKDSLAKMFDFGQRALRFFPNDVEAIRDMANAHSGEALAAYNAYFNIRQAVISKKNNAPERKEALALLDKAEAHLRQALELYQRLTTFARKGQMTDAHFNRDLMEENLLRLAEERKILGQIF